MAGRIWVRLRSGSGLDENVVIYKGRGDGLGLHGLGFELKKKRKKIRKRWNGLQASAGLR